MRLDWMLQLPEFQHLVTLRGQEAGALMCIEGDEIDLALNRLQKLNQPVSIFAAVIDSLQHNKLHKKGSVAAPWEDCSQGLE